MANYTYKFNAVTIIGGNSNSMPEYLGEGCLLFLFTTGTTSSAAKTAMDGSTAYKCFEIVGSISDNPTYQIVTTASTCYICGKAVRPGCIWGTTMEGVQLSQSTTPTVSIPSVTMATGNAYLTAPTEAYIRTRRGYPYYRRQRFSGSTIHDGTGALCVASSVTSHWDFTTISSSLLGKRYAALKDIYFKTTGEWTYDDISVYTRIGYNVTFTNGTALKIYVTNSTTTNFTFNVALFGYLQEDQSWDAFYSAENLQCPANATSYLLGNIYGGISQVREGYQKLGILIGASTAFPRYEATLSNGAETHSTFRKARAVSTSGGELLSDPNEAYSELYSDITISELRIGFS